MGNTCLNNENIAEIERSNSFDQISVKKVFKPNQSHANKFLNVVGEKR